VALVGGLQRARTASASAPLAVALLIGANLIPLVGVLVLGWDILTILVLYWIENGIIGVFNVLRMARAEGPAEAPRASRAGLRLNPIGEQQSRGYLISFFAFHYGLFWVVHGVFVFAIPAFAGGGAESVYRNFSAAAVLIGTVALAISHAVSYVRNFIGRGEYRRISPTAQFGQPYPRLFVLHITILAGAWVLISLGQPVLLVALLVALKTAFDLILHLREHGRLQALEPAPQRGAEAGV
jgi:hypothetical protein